MRLAPSTNAAISNSHGTASKKPFIIQTPNGSSNAAFTRMTPRSRSYSPSCRRTMNVAMSSVTLGKLCSNSTPPRNVRRAGNFSRESA
jgi:hypothetical protein